MKKLVIALLLILGLASCQKPDTDRPERGQMPQYDHIVDPGGQTVPGT
ncbi:MAG: hypothetical protein MJY83_00180 [Bacteroidales bacterium]|nr:hypothetical protein [Bacteroidales bacterium]